MPDYFSESLKQERAEEAKRYNIEERRHQDIVNAIMHQNDGIATSLDKLSISLEKLATSISVQKPPVVINLSVSQDDNVTKLKELIESLK